MLMLMTMFMVLSSWRGHCESLSGSFDGCKLSTRWPPTLKPSQPTWPVSPPVGCYHPRPPSPFISGTHPENWYSFYRPTEVGRLSRPKHCSNGAQPVPKAEYRSGGRDKHNYPRPVTPQSVMPPLDHCDLQRQIDVNNLSKAVARQRGGRESNSQPGWAGSGRHNCFFNPRCHTLDTRTVLLVCWYKAAFVGGMFSRDLGLCEWT